MSKYSLSLLLAAIFLSAALAASAQVAAFGPSEPVVSGKLLISVDNLRPGDEFELALEARVRDGYHIGAADKGALYPAKLTIDAPDCVLLDPPRYPAPKRLKSASGEEGPAYDGTFVIRFNARLKGSTRPGELVFTARFDSQGCKGDQCSPPETLVSKLKVQVAPRGTPVGTINATVFKPETAALAANSSDHELADKLARRGLFLRLLMLYGLGLLLAFTPCVYPMVPVTVGYFSAQGESRTKRVVLLAAVYVLGIALTYSILGAVAATTGGVFGAAMQSHVVLLGIALVSVALAMSMFGLYEIRPPAFIENRAAARSGIAGALVMGLIFGVVAAPCVGPVVLGLLLYVARLGSPLMGFLLFFVMAVGLGTPLFFLAAFAAKLPVAGMWMVAVKKLAGFLLIGAAAYFIGPVAPEQLRPYLIPAVIAAAGVYFAAFERSIRSHPVMAPAGRAFGVMALVAAIVLAMPQARGPALTWQPYNDQSIAQAAREHKPAMIDFTAEWCPACKELEHKTFNDPAVIKAAARFRRFRLDATDRNDPTALAAIKRHAVKGFPTVLFFDSSGSEAASARVVGFVDSEELLRRMEAIR
jgi:thiol:disulfide interchange protein DsbD